MMDAIEFRKVSFSYPNGFLANDNLNLVIQRGERVAFIGQNGAGKTTAAKMMNGLYKPTKGDVIVQGVNTKEKTTAQIACEVGYVFQNPDDQIFNSTVIREIEYMPRYFKLPEEEIKSRCVEAIKLTDIEQYKNMNPLDIPYAIRKFVTIAAVLVTKPKYIILDEPTAGQDYKRTKILQQLLDVLQAANVGVLVITHDMEFVVNNFKRVVVMANKHIMADDTVQNVFWNDKLVAESCISRPQIGEVARMLGLKEKILFREDMVEFFKDKL